MTLRFQKMHGLGNDFVIIDARDAPVEISAGRIRALADRRTGIGCDQLILVEPSETADLKMRIFNADGGEAEACGNAARCVALLAGGPCAIETRGGIISGRVEDGLVSIDMGAPRFGWDDIPLAYPMDTAALPVAWDDLRSPFAVNVGNPHLVFLVEDADAVALDRLGPRIETDPLFPERINVGVASRDGDGLRLRVWERGAGLTQACGTGACAAAVAAISRKVARTPVDVRLPGGTLTVGWTPGETMRMTGPASHVFSGEVFSGALAS